MHSNLKLSLFVVLIIHFLVVEAQILPSFELNLEWKSSIESLVNSQKKISLIEKKKLLIFSLHTGYEHWTIPHSEAVMEIIAQNSDSFVTSLSKDISVFEKDQLSKYDVVILNNNCPHGDRRDIFWDILKRETSLDDQQIIKKAGQLEKNLISFVKKGKGLMILHGGIVMQNNSLDFSDMVGGSFDYHPPQQKINVKLVDPDHILVRDFDPDGFVHFDEPYFFKNAYFRYNFRPLLYIDIDEITMNRKRPNDTIKYISWIKRFGRGRVFFSSPSHNAQSYDNPKFLQFLANGLYYAAGFISCDDSPIGHNKSP
tara:strand:+ start:684 stop:1622 length:939 start_codon:yes stop_codon:yes gene_type:complete